MKFSLPFSSLSNRAFRIVLFYLMFSIIWIYVSDLIVYSIEMSKDAKAAVSMLKGWLFVIITTLILFYLIRNALRRELSIKNKLEQSEYHHEQLFEYSLDGILYLETDGKVYAANKAACNILGVTEKEIIDGDINLFINKSDLNTILGLNKLRDAKYYSGEMNFRKKDGSTFPVEVSSKILKRKDGLEFQYIIFGDITERKNSELELERHRTNLKQLVDMRTDELDQTNRKLIDEINRVKEVEMLLRDSLKIEKELNEIKNRFLSTVSHEFKNPLTSILSSAGLIERNLQKWDEEKRTTHFRRIETAVKSLSRLLDDVTIIYKNDSNKLEILTEKTDLDKLCSEVIAELREICDESIRLEYNYIGETRLYELDSTLMRSVLNNLLGNAIKYSPNGGEVKLEVKSDGNTLFISITDNGIGIPKADFPKMFERFHRAENAKDIKGTGLGLSIVKRAIDLHKGEIKCESELGKGTKFTVKLPCESEV